MSNQTQPEQITRLLIQKQGQYAELEEMARIAVSVLHDDGWVVQRIETELSVTAQFAVTAKPVMKAGIAAELADAELRYTALRAEFVRLQQEQTACARRRWLTAGVACLLCSALSFFHLSVAMSPIGAACIVAWRFYAYRRAKGAK